MLHQFLTWFFATGTRRSRTKAKGFPDWLAIVLVAMLLSECSV